MTYRAPYLCELGKFLKARRGELAPGDVGLVAHSRHLRRVSGLRREEVAKLVAISTDYYTRIEQGRLAPSQLVFEALVRVLRLSNQERDYLKSLIDQTERRRPTPCRQHVRPQVRRILDQLTETPALVFGRHFEILAWNSIAATVLADISQMSSRQRNYVRMVFTDPAMRTLYVDWEGVARTCVAILRKEAAGHPNDPYLSTLIGELTIADTQFCQWWAARRVATHEFGTKALRHSGVGELMLNWDTFRYAGDPDQQLVLWPAEPGSTSHERLRVLASQAGDM